MKYVHPKERGATPTSQHKRCQLFSSFILLNGLADEFKVGVGYHRIARKGQRLSRMIN